MIESVAPADALLLRTFLFSFPAFRSRAYTGLR